MLRGSGYSNVRCKHTTQSVCGEWAEREEGLIALEEEKSFLERDILIHFKRLSTILIRAESSFRAAVADGGNEIGEFK